MEKRWCNACGEVSRFLAEWRESETAEQPLTFCVVAASEKVRGAIAQQLQKAGLETVVITAQSSRTDKRGVVYLSTMHRAKGLEFDCVAVLRPRPTQRKPKTAAIDDSFCTSQ